MSETPTEPPPFPWLATALVESYLKTSGDVVEQIRQTAAQWVEDQRPDLIVVGEDVRVFLASPRLVSAALLLANRLYSRKDSPSGIVSFAELGGADVLRRDPDIARLIGAPAVPAVG